jgi:diguanylate cyclase (GGDEF)-like protein/PAS domain S-box-containing protein
MAEINAINKMHENRPSILAVDDTPAILFLLQMTLSQHYDVTAVPSGFAALEATEKRRFDMVLLDLMMPGMDGLETLRQLRQQANFANTPVVFLTAADDLGSERTALELGADDYIIKPFKPTLVQLRISNLLHRARLQNELELALASADQGLWEYDVPGDEVIIDARRGEPLGLDPEITDEKKLSWITICHPECLERINAARDEHLAGKSPAVDVDVRLRNQHGVWVWINIYGKASQTGENGQIIRLKGTYRNIEMRKKAEQALRQSEEQLRFVMEATGEGIWDWLVQTDVVTHNASWCRLLGLNEQYLHHPVSFFKSLIHPDDQEHVETALLACLGGHADMVCEYRLRHVDGHDIWVLDRGKVVEWTADGSPVRMVGSVRDITERKMIESELKRLALFDPLTGLPNRRLLVDRLHQAVANCKRHHSHGGLMFIDLDRFKQLNDTLGHDIGDLLLVEVGRRLQTCIRGNDTAARLGGDEFIVLLTELSIDRNVAQASATQVGEKILNALNQPYQLGPHPYSSTPSIGLALFSGENSDVDTILKRADAAMYDSKNAGRNCLKISG